MSICSLHPNMLFCNSHIWASDESFRDDFVKSLKSHIETLSQLNIDIAWTDNFYDLFWRNSPWRYDSFYKHHLTVWIHQQIVKTWIKIDPPPNTICCISPDLVSCFDDLNGDTKNEWLILLHCLIHKFLIGYIVLDDCNESHFNLSCKCEGDIKNTQYGVIKNPKAWYEIIDYITFWPKDQRDFDTSFRLMIDMCFYSEFRNTDLREDSVSFSFSQHFINNMLRVNDSTEKMAIVSSITKRIHLNFGDAGRDSGLQEEKISNFYRFRVSREKRIDHKPSDGGIIFLRFHPTHP